MSDETTASNVPKGTTGSGWRETVGILLFICVSGFPAAGKAGFFFDWGLDLPVQMAISIGGGALAGWLMAPHWHWAGIVGGAIAGPCGYFAVLWWATGRQQIFKLELVLAQAVGSLPGLLAYLGLYKLSGPGGPPDEPIPDEYRRPAKSDHDNVEG